MIFIIGNILYALTVLIDILLSHATVGSGGDERGGASGCKRLQLMVELVVEWGKDKLLLLHRAKKRLALYLVGCHYRRRPALGGSGSCTPAMLTSR